MNISPVTPASVDPVAMTKQPAPVSFTKGTDQDSGTPEAKLAAAHKALGTPPNLDIKV